MHYDLEVYRREMKRRYEVAKDNAWRSRRLQYGEGFYAEAELLLQELRTEVGVGPTLQDRIELLRELSAVSRAIKKWLSPG